MAPFERKGRGRKGQEGKIRGRGEKWEGRGRYDREGQGKVRDGKERKRGIIRWLHLALDFLKVDHV